MLVRAIGPGLAVFGGPGGDAQLTTAGARAGAFDIAKRGSADTILLVTLAPSDCSAMVRGVTGGGPALEEVYEVPCARSVRGHAA